MISSRRISHSSALEMEENIRRRNEWNCEAETNLMRASHERHALEHTHTNRHVTRVPHLS